jgi:muramoyltetrapeptide carboxypeptidase
MTLPRRSFLTALGAATLAPVAATARLPVPQAVKPAPRPVVKPARLKPGDTVGLIDPASASFETVDIDIVTESMAALGLKVKHGRHLMERYGYLAGHDKDRADDVNRMFEDKTVNAVLAVRGGWGCSRLLPYLDFDLIARNPKVLTGYSDVTALLLPVHARTGLVTFHGPVGVSSWTPFSVDYWKRVLFEGEAVTMRNPSNKGEHLAQVEDRVRPITPGKARGRLLGGNLTVLTTIVGSPYLPDWRDCILFAEDVQEQIYRIDRMLTQLSLAGILRQARGVVFGHCTKCEPGDGYGSLTLEEVMRDHLGALGVPAYWDAMFGHIDQQFTMPVGVEVELDATAGTITMLEAAVI